jgi:glycine/D-amino acid oxidase-like deaminating enzyme
MSQRHETDVLIIGGGISAALMAEKLAERQSAPSIIVVEAGQKIFDVENRMRYRQRMLEYGENPWPGDTIGDQSASELFRGRWRWVDLRCTGAA